jgi:hypothetical protein
MKPTTDIEALQEQGRNAARASRWSELQEVNSELKLRGADPIAVTFDALERGTSPEALNAKRNGGAE